MVIIWNGFLQSKSAGITEKKRELQSRRGEGVGISGKEKTLTHPPT